MSRFFKSIGRAKCILVRHDWEEQEHPDPSYSPRRFKVTEGKIYDVIAVNKGDNMEWLLVIADDGLPGSYRRDWFEYPIKRSAL